MRVLAIICLVGGPCLLAGAASGAPEEQRARCDRLISGRTPRLHQVKLGNGLVAFVADRYGGYVAKQVHGAVQFSLRFRRGDRIVRWRSRQLPSGVRDVETTLDGRHATNPFYKGHLALGRHRMDFAITLASGDVKHLVIGFTLGACDDAGGYRSRGSRGASFSVYSANNETGGNPAIARLDLRMRGVSVRLPASAIGRSIGALRVSTIRPVVPMRVPAGARRDRAVIVARQGRLRVRYRPGSTTPFTVTGLPPATTAIFLELRGAGTHLLGQGRHPVVTAALVGAHGERAKVVLEPVCGLCRSF